jgi:hypothetical protein
MLAREGKDLIDKNAIYQVSEKLDGVPVCIRDGVALSRQGKPILSIQHIINELPNEGEFVGELYIKDKPFEYISGKVRQHTPCEELTLYLFPEFDMPQGEYLYVEQLPYQLFTGGDLRCLRKYSFISKTIPTICSKPEGFIARRVNTPWVVGKRSKDYLKLLDHPTLDLKVVAFQEAIDKEGNPTGRVGKFVCLWHTGTCNVSAGKLTHEMSREIFSNQEDYVGKIIQVKYKPSTYSVPRQPTFQHFREDKLEYQTNF